MRSSELAHLAGVTVRTLRHYHQIGVLPEPERSSNGYRDYDVHALVRILRVRRLVALGVPLDNIPPILDAAGHTQPEVLNALDTELAQQIERLTRQRDVLALLRQHGTLPDLPPELAPFHAILQQVGLPSEVVAMDRDQALLLTQLIGEEGERSLVRAYERLSDPGHANATAETLAAWAPLGGDSTDDDIEALAQRLAAIYQPLLNELGDSTFFVPVDRSAHALAEHAYDLLNPQQRRVLELVEAKLAAARSRA